MGNKNCRARTSFLSNVWFLNLWSGSSGKKISESLCLSFWKVVVFGGKQTVCGSDSVESVVETLMMVASLPEKFSTLFELRPISEEKWW